MIQILDCKGIKYFSKIRKLLAKRKLVSGNNKSLVEKIVKDIKKNGDRGLIKYEKKFSKNREIIVNNKKILKNIKNKYEKFLIEIKKFSYKELKKEYKKLK